MNLKTILLLMLIGTQLNGMYRIASMGLQAVALGTTGCLVKSVVIDDIRFDLTMRKLQAKVDHACNSGNPEMQKWAEYEGDKIIKLYTVAADRIFKTQLLKIAQDDLKKAPKEI